MMRTSTAIARSEPSLRTVLSCSARSSLTCAAGGSSPISSRKSVPRDAASKWPARARSAPENAPRSWPKRSDSTSPSGKRAAVDLLERAAQAAAPGVNCPREQLLAGAGFALDQDGDVVRRHPLRARPRPDQRRAPADDPFELGGGGRQARGQPRELLVRRAQQRRHVLGRDVERHGYRPNARLRVRLDQFGRIAGLGQQHPHRLHGGRPRADVNRHVRVGTEGVAGELQRPDRRPMNGRVVGRVVQGLGPKVHMGGAPASASQSVNSRLRSAA